MNAGTNADPRPAVSDTEGGREGGRGRHNSDSSHWNKLKWRRGSETQQTKEPDRECLQIPLRRVRARPISAQSGT